MFLLLKEIIDKIIFVSGSGQQKHWKSVNSEAEKSEIQEDCVPQLNLKDKPGKLGEKFLVNFY